jgi:hypothetical protein
MSKTQAQINASCAIAVGIIMDQVDALIRADVFRRKGLEQAQLVSEKAQLVLNTLPTIQSARGKKRIHNVCEVIRGGFKREYPHMAETAVMGALTAIFASHASMCELIRIHKLRGDKWRKLDQTSTKLIRLILKDMPEEEGRLWDASVPVLDVMAEAA